MRQRRLGVKTSTETRELVTLDVAGSRIVGTYHKTQEYWSSSTLPIGVLFVHPGTLPRSAFGDAAVYWADALAACGYPSFRFDLPGLGDSDGDLPETLIDFQSSVNEGEYALKIAPIMQDLVDRFDLSGLVLVGLCAGAVTALYAAAADQRVKGVILMDPYFNLQGESNTRRVAEGSEEDWEDVETSGWQASLPRTANLPLIRCWNRVASSGRPILVFCSPSSTPKLGAFDYLGYLLQQSHRGSRVASIPVDRTNHSFAEYGGKQAVRQHAEEWLAANFPLAAWTESEAMAHHQFSTHALTPAWDGLSKDSISNVSQV